MKRRKHATSLKGLVPGMRMKGGVRYDPQVNGFVAIVHIWDNVQCRGKPEEWRAEQIFPTEEAAMRHYKTTIRPALQQMTTEMTKKQSGAGVIHRKLE